MLKIRLNGDCFKNILYVYMYYVPYVFIQYYCAYFVHHLVVKILSFTATGPLFGHGDGIGYIQQLAPSVGRIPTNHPQSRLYHPYQRL